MDISKLIANYAYEANGDWSRIANMIKNSTVVKDYEIEEKYITIFDDNYPSQLKELRFPPWILFYEGNLSYLNYPCVSIVGSRVALEYGVDTTRKIVRKLCKDYVFVSGLAKGIDATVHETALSCGKTVGVLGCGLGTIYPKCNTYLYTSMRENHLIVTEYPKHVGPEKQYFPWRNRLIAALGKVTIVTQARIKSGTMLTVNEALNLSKDIYCVPYPLGEIEGEGCNLLIQQGAQIITSIDNFEI